MKIINEVYCHLYLVTNIQVQILSDGPSEMKFISDASKLISFRPKALGMQMFISVHQDLGSQQTRPKDEKSFSCI